MWPNLIYLEINKEIRHSTGVIITSRRDVGGVSEQQFHEELKTGALWVLR